MKKLKDFLFGDDRKLRTRAGLSALACCAFVITFLMAGPLEIFFANTMFIEYTVGEVMLPVILTGVAVFCVLFGLSFAFKGRVFNWYVSLLAGLSIAGYVQVMFMNSSVVLLDGTKIHWEHMDTTAVIGGCIWLLIIAAFFVFLAISKKIWKGVVTYICVLLSILQVVSVVSVALMSEIHSKSVVFGTNDGELSLSDKHNVIMIVADSFDGSFAQEIMETEPEYFDEFEGFTWYKNSISHYYRTFPNVAYLFSGEEYNYDIEYDEYMKNAWEGDNFFSEVQAGGYNSRVYLHQKYVNSDIDFMNEYCDNYKEAKRDIYTVGLEKQMLILSMYRTAPVAFKQYFETDTDQINSAFSLEQGAQLHTSDSIFYQKLTSKGLEVNSTASEKGTFTYYHFNGCHGPYKFDEKCLPASEKITPNQAARGALTNISEYLSQLKEQGIYEKSTIIVTADHGITGAHTELDKERTVALFYKPAGVSKGDIKEDYRPIQFSNIVPTLLKEMGLDYSAYGTPIDEVKEDEDIVRYFYMSAAAPDGSAREYELVKYEVRGDANDFNNWKLIERMPIEFPFLKG